MNVHIKHKNCKNINFVQQQCEHHQSKVLIESFHLSGHTIRFCWTVQDLIVFLPGEVFQTRAMWAILWRDGDPYLIVLSVILSKASSCLMRGNWWVHLMESQYSFMPKYIPSCSWNDELLLSRTLAGSARHKERTCLQYRCLPNCGHQMRHGWWFALQTNVATYKK